ncbi:MAG: AmmeMemoRadiSam system radical SAM enzyme [Deltaproteobacteria bacterium]|nr:AmmeMemoRadiSam system radical SAM enzyme [Deltaproteobacteria bacterium]
MPSAHPSLDSAQARLEHLTRPMALMGREGGEGKVRCVACAHRCLIPPGHQGVCKVRFNRDGVGYGPWGYVSGLNNDPVEKKPFYHVFPGTSIFSFGMLGCDFHCPFCQNWVTSQTLRDPESQVYLREISPQDIVAQALAHGSLGVASTYNEPLITLEWAVEVFRLARTLGLYTAFVSNGNNTPEAVEYLAPWLDACNIDLKCFQDKTYRKLGGTLEGVKQGIERMVRAGIWVEVTTLVIPGMNDSPEELTEMARWLAGVSPDMPWHVTAFHPDYKMDTTPATPPQTLARAHAIGREAGLRYVYTGNLPGRVQGTEHTCCPECKTLLIERRGFHVLENKARDGRCPTCGLALPGRWG